MGNICRLYFYLFYFIHRSRLGNLLTYLSFRKASKRQKLLFLERCSGRHSRHFINFGATSKHGPICKNVSPVRFNCDIGGGFGSDFRRLANRLLCLHFGKLISMSMLLHSKHYRAISYSPRWTRWPWRSWPLDWIRISVFPVAIALDCITVCTIAIRWFFSLWCTCTIAVIVRHGFFVATPTLFVALACTSTSHSLHLICFFYINKRFCIKSKCFKWPSKYRRQSGPAHTRPGMRSKNSMDHSLTLFFLSLATLRNRLLPRLHFRFRGILAFEDWNLKHRNW